MMKRWTLFLLLVAGMTTSNARSMKDFLVSTPSVVQNILSHENWLDCVDFIASGMKASVKNNFGDVSTLTALSDNYARIEISPVSSMEFKMLPIKKDTIICVVRTYILPNASESELHVYRSDWRRLISKYFVQTPSVKQFVKKGTSKENLQHVTDVLHPTFITAYHSEETDEMRFEINVGASNEEQMRELEPFLYDGLVYKWNGRRFTFDHAE